MNLAENLFVVTGGCGFIGSHVVDLLVARGAKVRIFDAAVDERFIREHISSGAVEIHSGDIRDPGVLTPVVTGASGVFHMAVLPLGPCTEDPRRALDVNVTGTFNVLEAAREAGVKKIVFSSASSVYGDTLEVMDESHPLGARTMYGATKVAGEYLFRAFRSMYELEYVALRYMNVYGPRQTQGLIPAVIRRITQGESPLIQGEGTQSFDFVHVEDVALANITAMTAQADDVMVNVGSGTEVSVREIVDLLLRLTSSDLEPVFDRSVNVPMLRRVGSSAAARSLLGFEATIGLEDGLASTLEWWQAHEHELSQR